jgi:hypothetical protein
MSMFESACLMYHHAKYNECLNKKQKLRVFPKLPLALDCAFVIVLSVFSKKSLKIATGNQNPYIEEQTTQWQKKAQKNNNLENIHIKLN